MTLTSRLKASGAKTPAQKRRTTPLWLGPESAEPLGGITFSMLSRFLVCPERFCLYALEGFKVRAAFEPRIEYGQMWHTCEEALAAKKPWEPKLKEYCQGLARLYPLQGPQVEHWYGLCSRQFPLYVKHWAAHPDVKARVPLFQEKVFHVAYSLPSGRTVYLRGKFDSVDNIVDGKTRGIYIQENKTKSQIDYTKVARQLTFDLQTMIYVVALGRMEGGYEPNGVRYNVIKRSAHKQGAKETRQGFLDRFAGLVEESPADWFARWKVDISAKDTETFERQTLCPLLERLCDWYAHVSYCFNVGEDRFKATVEPHGQGLHWRHPFGIYNVLDEGGSSDLDEYLNSGSEVGLERRDTLFSELQE